MVSCRTYFASVDHFDWHQSSFSQVLSIFLSSHSTEQTFSFKSENVFFFFPVTKVKNLGASKKTFENISTSYPAECEPRLTALRGFLYDEDVVVEDEAVGGPDEVRPFLASISRRAAILRPRLFTYTFSFEELNAHTHSLSY